MLPLVFVPGIMDTDRLWSHQVRYLSDIATPSVADITTQETIEDMAIGVLSSAPQRFALVGFSLGGYVALEIMRHAAHRVAKLALLGTSAQPDTGERRQIRLQQIELMKRSPFEEFMRDQAPNYVHPDRGADPALLEITLAMAADLGPDVLIRQNMAATYRSDARNTLLTIDCPTLIMSGRQDVRRLPTSEELAAKIPNSRLVVVEECGHYLPIERPHAVTALLREWLLYAV